MCTYSQPRPPRYDSLYISTNASISHRLPRTKHETCPVSPLANGDFALLFLNNFPEETEYDHDHDHDHDLDDDEAATKHDTFTCDAACLLTLQRNTTASTTFSTEFDVFDLWRDGEKVATSTKVVEATVARGGASKMFRLKPTN